MKEWKSTYSETVATSKGVARASKLKWWFIVLVILGLIGAVIGLTMQTEKAVEVYQKGAASIIDVVIGTAHAQDGPAAADGAFNPKPFIVLGVFIVLAIVMLASFYSMLFSTDENTVATAGDVTKTLVGFFIGVGTSYFGV